MTAQDFAIERSRAVIDRPYREAGISRFPVPAFPAAGLKVRQKEALDNIRDAIREYLEAAIIPRESAARRIP
jgi:hypothetical protein